MTYDLSLAAAFPPASREDWLKLVRSALKERPFERLTTKTYELASYDRWSNLYVDMDELQEWKVRPAYTDEEIA